MDLKFLSNNSRVLHPSQNRYMLHKHLARIWNGEIRVSKNTVTDDCNPLKAYYFVVILR